MSHSGEAAGWGGGADSPLVTQTDKDAFSLFFFNSHPSNTLPTTVHYTNTASLGNSLRPAVGI